MSAPGGIEFNKDILSGIHNNLVEGLSDKNIDGFILGSWDFLRFKGSRKLSWFPVSDKLEDVLSSDFSAHVEFLEFSSSISDSDRGEISSSDTDVLSKSGFESFSNSGLDDLDLALNLGSNFKEDSF